MYKFLPILLFAFLLAEENQEPHFIQSDSLDFIWWETKIYNDILSTKDEVANFIDENKFVINADCQVYDVMRVDTLYQSEDKDFFNQNFNLIRTHRGTLTGVGSITKGLHSF